MNTTKNIIRWVPIDNKIRNNKYFINSKSITLNYYLSLIKNIESVNCEIVSGKWDSHIKHRKSYDHILREISPSLYKDRGVWRDFIFFLEGNFNQSKNIIFDPLSTHSSLYLGILLKLFWRNIAYKLKSKTFIKIQLRIQFKQFDESNKQTYIVRSISKVQIVNNEDYTDLFKTFNSDLNLLGDNYENLYISSFILFYSILNDDSVLNKSIIVLKDNKSIWNKEKKHLNKNKLKINYKNLPNTTNLKEWGSIKIVEGDYPYDNKINNKILIKASNLKNKDNIVEIKNWFSVNGKKVILSEKKIIIQKVSVQDSSFKKTYFEFIDIIQNSSEPDSFVRIYDNKLFIFEGGKIVYSQKRKKISYFKTLNKDQFLSNNFITMDLETKEINGVLEPYCVSIFDGKFAYSFYITEYETSSHKLMKAAITFVLKRKYNKHKIYIHNFSHFDGIFLMKIISELVDSSNIKPVIRDNRIISLKVRFSPKIEVKNRNKKYYYVEFRDSYLLLTSSLEKLGKTFALNKGKFENKLPFPYKFVNEPSVDYNYIGLPPDIQFYENYTEVEYSNIAVKDVWDIKKETIKYCEQDCKTLYYSIKEFSKEVFKEFKVDISHTPTISSLAFRIFRVQFLDKKNNIAVLKGLIYEFIYQGFYGGAVDAYIPRGNFIKSYDVNSLYPNSMGKNKMPIGNPYYFEGNVLEHFNKINFNYPSDEILNGNPNAKLKPKTIFDYLKDIFEIKNKENFNSNMLNFLNLNIDKEAGVLSDKNNLPYGFFEVEIETPTKFEINQPILLKRHKTINGGVRTIAPVGKWTGIYFSQELYNALNKNPNYKFRVKRGFLFRQKNLFDSYIKLLFKIKESSIKNSPRYSISKLLLNSLYGRFGMNPDKPNHMITGDEKNILNKINKESVYLYNDVLNVVDLGNGKELISYTPKSKFENSNIISLEDENENSSNLLINVSIAAAITGFSRIFMSLFKDNPLFKLYYSDTDSIFLDLNLESIYPELVGKELGQLKPEYEFEKAVFLGPKLYGGITTDESSLVKASGVKTLIPFESLETLIKKGASLQIPTEKWYRNLDEGNIKIKNEIYNLAISSTKRELIYDKNGLLINTQPFEINE